MKISDSAVLFSLFLITDSVLSQQPVCLEHSEDCQNDSPCGLWLAESLLFRGLLGIFSGTDLGEGETVGEGDLLVPIYDSNQNEWSLWQDVVWNGDIQDDLMLQNHYQLQSFIPGVGSNVICSAALGNIDSSGHEEKFDSSGVHRSKDPSAGSFSYRHNFEFFTTQQLRVGQELFTHCGESAGAPTGNVRRMTRPLPWLKENGLCVDNIAVKPSTKSGIGRGAFAKRRVKKGDTIVSSPVVQFDRSQTEIVKQFLNEDERLEYTEHVEHHQLLLNYCYGHPNSTVLLLPYGPGVNFINHHQQPNAILDWSESSLSDEEILDLTASDALEKKKGRLIVDYVALRDIEPGEEIFLDYGGDWEKAWEAHVQVWEPPESSELYTSAAEYKRANFDELIRTVEEQEENPYPDNLVTACLFQENLDEYAEYQAQDGYNAEEEAIYWNSENEGCLRPCKIMGREVVDGKYFYAVQVEDVTNKLYPDYCELPPNPPTVLRTPARVVRLVDKAYTSDQQLKSTFRHEVGVPGDMYPEHWMSQDPEPMGDFQSLDLKPGQIEQIKWADSGEVVTPHAHLIGLSPKVRMSLLDYCDRMGITETFRRLTYRGNALQPGENKNIVLQGLNWYVQRPESHWKSNMHWISPLDAYSQNDYLRALSAAGFDDVLRDIGEHFGFDGLAAYHVTFIAVSHCTQGYMHYDVSETGARVFNVIIPLILAEDTGPELDLRVERDDDDDEDAEVGRLRYQYDAASMMGDDAYHATSAVDYRVQKEMRMAATVYIGDINEDNIDNVLSDYTQHYPPKDRPDILLGMAGTHWHRDDPSARLPEPFVGDFETDSLEPYAISPLTWKRTQEPVSGSLYRVGLPSKLRQQLLDYCGTHGITKRFRSLLVDGEELVAHSTKTQGVMEDFGGHNWYIQRPPKNFDSNMHWMSPADANAHEDLLNHLFEGGFEGVMKSIGEHFELEGLVVYHLSFVAVSHCVRGYVRNDFSGADGDAFNVIIPLITVNGTGPELGVEDTHGQTGGYRYAWDEAPVIGDGARHATGWVDYRKNNEYRLAASIYVADVNEENVGSLLKNFTQAYPPKSVEGEEVLLSWAGRHWKSSGS